MPADELDKANPMKVSEAPVQDAFREIVQPSRRGKAKRVPLVYRATIFVAGLLSARNCFGQEQLATSFDPEHFRSRLSEPAQIIYRVSVLTLIVCAGIFLIVAGLLTYAIVRYRRRGSEDDEREPPQVYGSAAIELAWTVPPILIVVVLVLVTARTIGEIRNSAASGQ